MIKTDLTQEQAGKEIVHERYKNLAMVEQGFRIMKTALLETRPIFVRKDKRTRGHVVVVMLAYRITRLLKKLWKNIAITVKEGMKILNTICGVDIRIKRTLCRQIPEPREMGQRLLKAARVILPEILPNNRILCLKMEHLKYPI